MSDIELVIKIDEEQYEFIKQSMTMDKVKDYHALLYAICEHIKNGTPLPKGHGRIVDMDAAIKCIEEVTGDDAIWAISLIEWAYAKRTIIEADKAKIPEIWKRIREDRLADAGYPPLSRDLPAIERED